MKRQCPRLQPPRCYHCDAEGHYKRDCPKLARRTGDDPRNAGQGRPRGQSPPPPWSPPRRAPTRPREVTPMSPEGEDGRVGRGWEARSPASVPAQFKRRATTFRPIKRAKHTQPEPAPMAPMGGVVNIFHGPVTTVNTGAPSALTSSGSTSRPMPGPLSRFRGAQDAEEVASSSSNGAVERSSEEETDSASQCPTPPRPPASNRSGREDRRQALLCAGDVEPNPGPMCLLLPPFVGFRGALVGCSAHCANRDRRPDLLLCGDVEANPGPARYRPGLSVPNASQRNMAELWHQRNNIPLSQQPKAMDWGAWQESINPHHQNGPAQQGMR